MTIHVDLRPDLERFANALVESGRYASVEEVVAAALEELALQESEAADLPIAYSDDELRAMIAEADAKDDWRDSKEVFARLRAKLKAAG